MPYGNANTVTVNGHQHTECQHGPVECEGNMLELCAIHLNPKWTTWFPYLVCLEQHGDKIIQAGEECATSAGLDWTSISSCYGDGDGALGKKLVLAASNATGALQPPHQYTPWVTLNGKPLYTTFDNLAQLVCDAYTGPKPAVCK